MFIKFGLGSESQVRTFMPFIVLAFKMWVYSLKNRNFWYKFGPKGKFRGSTKNLNTGAQLQTFLCAMTP